MEIRLLQGTELAWAVETANEVFETCVRFYTRTQEEINQYYRYVNAEYLWQEVSARRLMMWGAFENGQMCAVSAMQNVGHITMLYVKQEYQHRRIGMQLLQLMRGYAALVWRQNRVTINVTPSVCAPFFYRMGFREIPGMEGRNFYISMECRLPENAAGYQIPGSMPAVKKEEVTYSKKPVRIKTVLMITAAFFVLSIGIMSVLTIHHMVTDGLNTEENAGDDWDDPSGAVEV